MIVLSHKSILVSELRIDNLNDFYEGLPHRYNSIIDLLHHKQEICVELLKRLRLTKTLKYRLVIASNEKIRIPLLECLEINGLLGGMLSTYLHDHDRNIIESSGNIIVNPLSIFVYVLMEGVHKTFEISIRILWYDYI